MPYVECPRCGLTTFSAAYLFSVEHCIRCGAPLPQARVSDVTYAPPPSHRAGREPPKTMRLDARR